MSIWHFTLLLRYFNIQSPPHDPITVKSLLCVPQSLMFSFFSLTMSWQWNEPHSVFRMEGWRWRVKGGRWRQRHRWDKRRGECQCGRDGKKRWVLEDEALDFKGRVSNLEGSRRLRNWKYNLEETRWIRRMNRQELSRCFYSFWLEVNMCLC